ncbi:hypothetical protein [Pseudomonas sp. G5(2012)]|uniref:hypothetical protein n=1 Tax=Pseudomonas sp. G5(2012) TaxID=1268068 RepID=UPI0005B4AD90|nr:hypothetical protein [Pseudomonas sp. G5(2012)]
MFLKIDGGYADWDFDFLSGFLEHLDIKLSLIDAAIKKSRDPDSDGLCDQGEYIIGVGFTAVQRYIGSTYKWLGFDKLNALRVPPEVKDGLCFVEIVNAGANYWKHLDEWDIRAVCRRDVDALNGNKNAVRTIETIEKITPWADYTCSNLLAALLGDEPLKLSLLLPKIAEWRSNLDAQAPQSL